MDRLTWPLVGRERELADAARRLSEHPGGGVVVVGDAGVGKTRLAGEIADAAAARGHVVRWVRATRSTTSIPLGAFAALLPPPEGAVSGVTELLARARHALIRRRGERPMLLCVDDAQLLDDASAALVHQLVAGGDVFAVVTLRAGEPPPDAVQALWKDEHCDLVRLEGLRRVEVRALFAEALGGEVDGRTLELLWELTHGNALFLRELILHGLEQGALDEDGGIWRWRGDMRVGMRLAELVGARLAVLPAAAVDVLELVAIAAPLQVALLDAGELTALETLERHDLVQRAEDRGRRFADVAHPLHGEVIRARLARTRLEAIAGRLAGAVEARGARRRTDVLRVAGWRLQAGATGEAELFVRAAEQALAALDWSLAERLAQAAVQAGGGFGARLALARAQAGGGRVAEAELLLSTLQEQARGDAERLGVATARASNLFWGLDRTDEADRTLRAAEQAIAGGALRAELVGLRAWLDCTLGQPGDALAAAAPLLAAGHARVATRLRAALTVGTALTMRGRSTEALAVIDEWLPRAREQADELPLLEGQLLGTRPLALQGAGELVAATGAAQHAYEHDLAARSPEGTAFAAFALGSAWLARGRVRQALHWYRESAALAREADTIGFLPWALAGIAQAAAQAGDSERAGAALDELAATPARGTRNFEVGLELTRAWCAAARGELSSARVHALAAADRAESLGQEGFAVRAAHDLARFGDPAGAAARLRRLSASVDGHYAPTACAHAGALLRNDGATLLEVAERFATQDALLLAAEVAHAAAAAFEDRGREASARAAAQRAGILLERCEGAWPPTIRAALGHDVLTAREREVALLAAAGLTSRQIAGRLVVSVRTVDNHLQRVYRKLGVSRREELVTLVPGRPE